MKAHFGCGRVYLRQPGKDWVNYDVPGPHTCLAADHPELVERLATDNPHDGYYARFADLSASDVAQADKPDQRGVCDAYGAPWDRPAGLGSCSEILTRQMLEHFSDTELDRAMQGFDYMLKPGGLLRIDVPDYEATIAALDTATGDARALLLRHLFGPRRTNHGRHLQGFTRAEVIALAERWGFDYVREDPPLKHRLYPAFCLLFRKPEARIDTSRAWEYLCPTLPADARCLEVGPGSRRFWPRANVVIDVEDRGAADLPEGAEFHQCSVEAMPFPDGSFDYALCAHVLEHVEDPDAACRELARVATRGAIECPHPFKELLFGFEEHDHKWFVWPGPMVGRPEQLVFTSQAAAAAQWRDSEWGAAMTRILAMGPLDSSDGGYLRRWYRTHHRSLNTVATWDPGHPLTWVALS